MVKDEFAFHELNLSHFIKFLKLYHGTIIKEKESLLFNPCKFVPPQEGEGYRRQEYFKQSSFMVLDFDNGNLSPEEFERIFWHEAGRGRKSFLICNSFSRCEAKPNKFRVVMFYKRPALSLDHHRAVHDAIVRRLEKYGYTEESTCLDPGCKSGNQSFYVPCTNRAHPEWAFFRTYGTRARELERYAIDPVELGEAAAVTSMVPRLAANSIVVAKATPEKIDAATATLRSMNEGRNHEMFMTGLNLSRLGLSENEITAELNAVVGAEPHMRKKISGVMKSLRGYGRRQAGRFEKQLAE